MDKLMQITIGASVLLAAAAILLFMFNDQSQGFGNFIDKQSQNAQCDLSEQKYRSACCRSSPNFAEGNSVYNDADSSCDWKGSAGIDCGGSLCSP